MSFPRPAAYTLAAFLLLTCLTGNAEAQEKNKNGTVVIPDGLHLPVKPIVRDFLVDIVSIEVKETPDGPTFVMKGVSKFPDGTTASVAMRFYEEILPGTYRRVKIKDGKFEATFDASKLWPGKKLFPGNYEFEVEVDPRRESHDMRKLIESKSRAYRNKYVTVGVKEEMKQEEDKLKEHYCNAIWGAQNLYSELKEKFKAAKVKYTSRFYKPDNNGKPQIDPNNKNAYVVDMQKFLQYLRNNPNEFYDNTGRFREQVWRNWLDNEWRPELRKAMEKRDSLKNGYVAIPWPRQFNEMTSALKMLVILSAERSASLYKWGNLPLNEKDRKLLEERVCGPSPDPNIIKRLILSVRYKLRLDEYLRSKQDEEKKAAPQKPASEEKQEPAQEPQEKAEPAEKTMVEIEEEKVVKVRKRQPLPKKKPEEDRSDFAYYFLAVLGIIAVAVILKRKI